VFFFSYHRVCGAQHQGWQSGNEEMGRIKEKKEKGGKGERQITTGVRTYRFLGSALVLD
jgi:hypothetical protein